jgi:hypothetical protein
LGEGEEGWVLRGEGRSVVDGAHLALIVDDVGFRARYHVGVSGRRTAPAVVRSAHHEGEDRAARAWVVDVGDGALVF